MVLSAKLNIKTAFGSQISVETKEVLTHSAGFVCKDIV